MGGVTLLTAKEIGRLKADEIEQALRDVTRALNANERERVGFEEARRRMFIRAGQLGLSQRKIAPWCELTNARIAQIVQAESPAKKAAAKRAAKKAATSRPRLAAVITPAPQD